MKQALPLFALCLFLVKPLHAEVLIDDSVRNGLRLSSPDARANIDRVSDVLVVGIAAYPIVFDAIVDSWLVQGNRAQAGEITKISAQSLVLSGLVRLFVRTAVFRPRPYTRDCQTPNADRECHSDDENMSFFSGHATFAFTGAGLICSARERYDLAGGRTACWAGLGTATFVAFARILADRHYFSDVLVGSAVGLTLGYVIPHFMGESADAYPLILGRGAGVGIAVRL